MNDQYYLPQETAQLLTQQRLQRCKNLGLVLDKYPTQAAVESSEGKSAWFKRLEPNTYIDTRLAESFYKRWLNTAAAMQAQHFKATTDWRMVVGLGGKTVLETDLTLHHLYGIPYIPGSALKGLTRAYVTEEVYKSEKTENDNPIVQRIFGTQKDAGSVVFFDALPTDGKIEIDLDIMNAHYPKYYGEKLPPTNSQDPNPVAFLTVTNTTFIFALAPRRSKDAEDVMLAIGWLQKALQEYGVGGKTSAGYGYFTPLDQQKATAAPSSSEVRKLTPTPYVRPNMRRFATGESIPGRVVASTDELRHKVPEAKAFLAYLEFSTRLVLIAVDAEEATEWAPSQTKNCLFVREEEREGCAVLICQPRPKSKEKKRRG